MHVIEYKNATFACTERYLIHQSFISSPPIFMTTFLFCSSPHFPLHSSPFHATQDLLPMCYRCSTTNQLFNTAGSICTNCRQPFVFSFVSFGKECRVCFAVKNYSFVPPTIPTFLGSTIHTMLRALHHAQCVLTIIITLPKPSSLCRGPTCSGILLGRRDQVSQLWIR